MGSRGNRRVRLWIAIWFLLTTALSLAPLPAKRILHTRGPWHDPGHLLVFFGTGLLVLFGARTLSFRLLRVLLTIGFCALLESLQMIGTTNRFEWHDLKTDALGIFSALIAIIIAQTVSQPQNRRNDHISQVLNSAVDKR